MFRLDPAQKRKTIGEMADRKNNSINIANSLNNASLFWSTCANNKLDTQTELKKIWEMFKIIGALKDAHFSESIEEIVKRALRTEPF